MNAVCSSLFWISSLPISSDVLGRLLLEWYVEWTSQLHGLEVEVAV